MIQVQQIEANIVRHCNNRCVACSHASPFQTPYSMTPEILEADLKALAPIIHCNRFALLGGEPLLHPDICAMLDVARASGISEQVNVTTNGKLLPRMPEEFWQRVQHLFLSVYPNLDEEIVKLAQVKCFAYRVELTIARWTDFYLQFKPEADDGVESFKVCQWKNQCFTVHDGHFYLCPQAAFFTDRFMGLRQDTDGLFLAGVTEEILTDYMNRTAPFQACKICSPQSERVKWFQPRTEAEWIAASTHPRK